MDSKVIKVAQIVGEMNRGGVENVVMNYYRHIDRKKFQFDFIVLETSTEVPKEEIESMGGKVFVVPHYQKIFKYRKALLKIFRENDYDIVHSHINTLSVLPLQIAKRANVKVRIAHSHSTSNIREPIRNSIKYLLKLFSKKYATDYFACSELAGRFLFGNKAFDKGKVTIINNAIELERFEYNQSFRDEVRGELGLGENFVIGHIGRFVTQKNHTFIIDVFNEVLKNRPDSRLLLVGGGPLYDETVAKTEALGISDKVFFAGVCEDPVKYYQAMDCFMLPSLYEGLPVVGVEAQINGLKCFFSSEMTKETKIIESAEFIGLDEGVSAWAEKLLSFSENAVRDDEYGKFVGSKYDVESECKKLEKLYYKLAKPSKNTASKARCRADGVLSER